MYSLLGAFDEKDKAGNPLKLLRVRNPWGHGEWTGNWSDESDSWYPELEARINKVDKDDGVFHLCLDDYYHFFASTTICFEHGCSEANHGKMATLEHDFSKVANKRSSYGEKVENTAAKHMVFYEVDIKEKMDLRHDDFIIQAMQQGDRQRAYRSEDPAIKYEMSPIGVFICTDNHFLKSATTSGKASK